MRQELSSSNLPHGASVRTFPPRRAALTPRGAGVILPMPHTGRASFIVKGFLNQPHDGGSRPPTVLTRISGPRTDLWKRVTGARRPRGIFRELH